MRPLQKLIHLEPIRQRPTVLIHCQYVYGIGHFVRAVELARCLSQSFNVHLVSGGEPIPNFALPDGIKFTQLPAIFKNEASGCLISVNTELSIDDCLAVRTRMLTELVEAQTPDIIITEHFPFGLLFEVEVIGLLRQVRQLKPETLIVSSVRDVIDSAHGSSSDNRTCDVIEEWFDLILVHGDARVIPLSNSFPMIDRITVPHVYTGYVVEPALVQTKHEGPPILVGAIGGGRIGQELLDALIAAHHRLSLTWPHQLRLFLGAFEEGAYPLAPSAFNLQICPFDRAKYRQALAAASGLICLGGYNTVLEALSLELPTLVYKRQFLGTNREQALRAEIFQGYGLLSTLEADELTPELLAERMASHFSIRSVTSIDLDFQGAENTRCILLKAWFEQRENTFPKHVE